MQALPKLDHLHRAEVLHIVQLIGHVITRVGPLLALLQKQRTLPHTLSLVLIIDDGRQLISVGGLRVRGPTDMIIVVEIFVEGLCAVELILKHSIELHIGLLDVCVCLLLLLLLLLLLFPQRLRQKQIVHVIDVHVAHVALIDFLELIEVDMLGLVRIGKFPLLEVLVVENGAHVQPEVELGVSTGEAHPEVTEDLLIKPVQIQDQIVVRAAFLIGARFPLAHLLLKLTLPIFVVQALRPLIVVEDLLNRVVLHVGDGDLEVLSHFEGTQAD